MPKCHQLGLEKNIRQFRKHLAKLLVRTSLFPNHLVDLLDANQDISCTRLSCLFQADEMQCFLPAKGGNK